MALGVTSYTMAGLGVFGYTAYINTQTSDASGMMISIAVSIVGVVAGFASEMMFYKDAARSKARRLRRQLLLRSRAEALRRLSAAR